MRRGSSGSRGAGGVLRLVGRLAPQEPSYAAHCVPLLVLVAGWPPRFMCCCAMKASPSRAASSCCSARDLARVHPRHRLRLELVDVTDHAQVELPQPGQLLLGAAAYPPLVEAQRHRLAAPLHQPLLGQHALDHALVVLPVVALGLEPLVDGAQHHRGRRVDARVAPDLEVAHPLGDARDRREPVPEQRRRRALRRHRDQGEVVAPDRLRPALGDPGDRAGCARTTGRACLRSSSRTLSRNSSQVRTPRFCIVSIHIAGSERARSRAVSTTWRSEPLKASLMISILGRCRGARNSIDTTAVPDHAWMSLDQLAPGPSGSKGGWSGPPWSIRSWTAETCCFHRSQANLTPCSCRTSRFLLRTFWMKLVPDFIAPMWSTTRSATPGSIGQPRSRRLRNPRRRPSAGASSVRRRR